MTLNTWLKEPEFDRLTFEAWEAELRTTTVELRPSEYVFHRDAQVVQLLCGCVGVSTLMSREAVRIGSHGSDAGGSFYDHGDDEFTPSDIHVPTHVWRDVVLGSLWPMISLVSKYT